jgi:hypothetical protein
MPTDTENDPLCVKKKSHIGNDFVNIVFNESGFPFDFDTFPSQFNYVYIVITPESAITPRDVAAEGGAEGTVDDDADAHVDGNVEGTESEDRQPCYVIQTLRQASFPRISPTASYKLVALQPLSSLARQLALNASVFCNVWSSREGGEHISSWRSRLREIVKLRARHANTGASTSAKFPGAKASKTYADGDEFTGVVAMGGLAEEEGVLAGLDFSRWAGPNPSLA